MDCFRLRWFSYGGQAVAALLAMTSDSILAAGFARVLRSNHPQKQGGRGEQRVMASPMARLQQKKQAAVTTGSAGSTGIPRATVLRLIRALLGVPGLIVTVPPGSRRVGPKGPTSPSRGLTPASGHQDHTILPSASVPL